MPKQKTKIKLSQKQMAAWLPSLAEVVQAYAEAWRLHTCLEALMGVEEITQKELEGLIIMSPLPGHLGPIVDPNQARWFFEQVLTQHRQTKP